MGEEVATKPGDPRFVRFLLHWHGIPRRRRGPAGLRRTVAQLQGVSLPFSELEASLLPVRIAEHSSWALDELIGGGLLVWQGGRPAGRYDGEISLFLADDFPRLGRITVFASGSREALIRDALAAAGSVDFEDLSERLGGFPEDLAASLWKLVWNGEATSDSLDALRTRRTSTPARYRPRARPRYATRRRVPPGSAGRWRLLAGPGSGFAPESERRLAFARQSLDCRGVACRATVAGFDSLLPLFEALEAQGAARRAHWLDDDGAQFVAPGAAESWQASAAERGAAVLSARDPANPFGTLSPWPRMMKGFAPARSSGARVLLSDGELVGYIAPGGAGIHTPRDLDKPDRMVRVLAQLSVDGPVFIQTINGASPYNTPWHARLVAEGFSPSRRGYLLRGTSRAGRHDSGVS